MATRRPVDILPQVVNEVLVTTAKAFKAARRDGKGNPTAAAAAMETRIPAAVEKFNVILDEIECDFLSTKAVLERDLNQLRAKRQPPPPEPKPVAPPAPMIIDLESPKMMKKEPFTGLPGPSQSGNQASKPVAPFPNMGFTGASPKVAPSPNPKTAPNSKDGKNMARPAAAAAVRPASAPPKKETKVPPPQVPRPSSVAPPPHTPLSPLVQVKAPVNRQTPVPTPANAPGPAHPGSSAPAPAGNGNLFTDMTFSLAPPPGDIQAQKQAAQPQRRASQQQQPALTGLGISNQAAGDVPGGAGPADVANMGPVAGAGQAGNDSNMADVDDKIDGLFDLGHGDMDNMDLGYELGNGDNSNFNDMYFASGDSNGGAGEFDDAFFNLNG